MFKKKIEKNKVIEGICRKIIRNFIAINICVSMFAGNTSMVNAVTVDAAIVNDAAIITTTEPEKLYSIAACMIDAENGRILFEKNSDKMYPMASTTKILTCIIALEYANLDDLVTISSYAASMPDVQLGIKTDEKYILKDLLYSLMLKSHNDVAVAIAEHISTSVENFADLMNEKAREIGCTNYNFVTSNGLDGKSVIEDGMGNLIEKEHSITAYDLSLIMAYCIRNKTFLDITNTQSYSFCNKIQSLQDGSITNGTRRFSVDNGNVLLSSMDGVLSGKTGYTGGAGYCYVCAVKREDRYFVVSLLGAGWPPNKNYKWSDVKKILEYGFTNYYKKKIYTPCDDFIKIKVKGGYTKLIKTYTDKEISILLSEEENIKFGYKINDNLYAPVSKGDIVGRVNIYINDKIYDVIPIKAKETSKVITLKSRLLDVLRLFIFEK